MSSTRGRRGCGQEHCSCKPCLLRSVVVPALKFTQQGLSAAETSQLTYLLPRHDEETVHALNTQVWHHADHQSLSYKSCSVVVTFPRELLIQSCPAPELPPTHQLLAMVRGGVLDLGLYDGALYSPFRPSPLLFVVILVAHSSHSVARMGSWLWWQPVFTVCHWHR